MSSYSVAKEELKVYIRARTPFIVVESSERERVEKMLSEIAEEERIMIDYYTDSKQLQTLGGKFSLPEDINHDPLKYGFSKFSKNKHSTFVIGDITKIDGDNAYSREFLNLLYMAKESASTVIVITADEIWHRLSVLGMMVRLDFPNQAEIAEVIREFVSRYSGRFPIEWKEKDISQIVDKAPKGALFFYKIKKGENME